MPSRRAFSEPQWALLAPLVATLTRRGPRARDDRRFVEGVIWILRTGAPWRDLPRFFRKWNTLYRRFRRWAMSNRWESLRQSLLPALADDALLLIDSTIVKAHPHAAGALKSSGAAGAAQLGRSRGGFTTKLYALVSDRGHLYRYTLTPGQTNDITQAHELTVGFRARAVVGDRAYDCDAFIGELSRAGIQAIVPSRARRRSVRVLDSEAYRLRNVIERWFCRIKQYRRVATRYEKTAVSYVALVATAALCAVISGWCA